MKIRSSLLFVLFCASLVHAARVGAQLPTQTLFFQEVESADAVYAFNSPERYQAYRDGKGAGKGIELPGRAVGGRKLIGDNETAIDLYLFRHNLPGWERPAAKPVPPPFDVSWKDGKTTIKTKSSELKVSNRLQVRFTSEDLDAASATSGPERDSFRIRRFKTKVEGWVYSKDLEVELQVNWADTANLLDDADINFDLTRGKRAFMVKAGQFKVPFGRQQLTSAMNQQFVDRAAVEDTFARGRDIGLQLWGTPFQGRLDWRVGVFNGNGRTVSRNDNDDLQLDARVTLQPFGDVKYSEGDFESSGKFLLALSGQIESSTRELAAAGSTPAQQNAQDLWGGDLVVKFHGLSLLGEYYERSNDRFISADFDETGLIAQAGMFVVPKRLELAVRWAEYDPDTGRENDVRRESGIALGYFFNQHVNKLQADFRKIEDEARGSEDREIRFQYVLFF